MHTRKGFLTIVQQAKSGIKVRTWPTPQDYNEAVQNLHINVQDVELKTGWVETNQLGLPRPITGSFASVYKVMAGGRNWALRCFLRDIPDTQWRYGRIADFLRQNPLPYTVQFEFQFQGIQMNGRWYPVLKMDWVDGKTLDNYIREQIAAGKLDGTLAESFKAMCADLKSAGIAHGDLQHGNIMVRDGALYLVDYDGMFVPHINAPHSNELGHRNYQHPQRSSKDFGAYLDNFSAWVIYTSLKALSLDPSLFERLGACEDCLLFRREDFADPIRSCAFAALENHEQEELRNLARFIRWQLSMPVDKVPGLDAEPKAPDSLPPLAKKIPQNRRGAAVTAGDPQNSGLKPAGTSAAEGAADPWEEDADYKQYLSETHYKEETATTAHVPVPAVAVPPEKTFHIPAALFKPTPRAVEINPSCGRLNPLMLTKGSIAAFVVLFCLLNLLLPAPPYGHPPSISAPLSLSALMWVLSLVLIWWNPIEHRKLISHGTAVRGKVISKDIEHWEENARWVYTGQSMTGRHRAGNIIRLHHKCTVTYEYPQAVNGKIETMTATITLPDEQFRMLDDDEEIVVVHDAQGNSIIYKLSYYHAI
jgi:hypothetical protein